MFSKGVLMCSPRYFTVRDVKNPFMEGSVVDTDLAQAQWDSLRRAIHDAGVTTHTVEPVPDLEDMVFAANQAFIGTNHDGSRFVVMSRMRHPSRQREVPYYRDWFRAHGYEELEIDLRGECLEGQGDLLWHPRRPIVWAGYGHRSTRGGVERLAEALKTKGIEMRPLALTDPRFYHLDTCLSPLNEDAAIVFPGAFDPEAIARLRDGWSRLYEVTLDEALRFTCNGVVAGDRFISTFLPDELQAALAREGLHPHVVDLSEFEKSGGSAFCMKAFVE